MNKFLMKTSLKAQPSKKKVVIIQNPDGEVLPIRKIVPEVKAPLPDTKIVPEVKAPRPDTKIVNDLDRFPSDDSDSEAEAGEAKPVQAQAEAFSESDMEIEFTENTKAVAVAKPKAETRTRELKELWLSVCIPDSCIQKCQSAELRNHLISQIARTACIFMVDEVVLIRDHSYQFKGDSYSSMETLTKVLQYLETPQYLRKSLFPISQELKYVGLMAPLECFHHLKASEFCQWREGITLNRPTKDKDGSWCDVGLYKQLKLEQKIVANTRVTIKIDQDDYLAPNFDKKFMTGVAVSPLEPKQTDGVYWGYSVRNVKTFSHLYNVCPNQKGYQLKICIDSKFGQPFEAIRAQLGEDFHGEKRVDSIQLFFSGIGNLDGLIDADEVSKVKAKDALKEFDYVMRLDMPSGVRM
jgi:predicted SPOUT superfamily RNA methylase MTH1